MGLENWDFDCAISHVNKLQAEILKLRAENKRLAAPFGTLQEPLPLKSGSWNRDLVKSESGWLRIEREYAEDVETGKKNDEINAANQELVASVRKVIIAAGFPETHLEYKRSKPNRVPSGWSVGIRAATGPTSAVVESRMKDYRGYRENFLAEKAKAEAEAERAKQAEADRRAADIEFVDLCRAVGLDPVSTDAGDLEDAIRSKCKYLNLAAAGMDVCNDWSDGCWKVENALGDFEVVTPEDKAIHEDWWSECNDFEDGRQFRDCTWNYDRIIAELADSTAVALWGRFQKIRFDLSGSR